MKFFSINKSTLFVAIVFIAGSDICPIYAIPIAHQSGSVSYTDTIEGIIVYFRTEIVKPLQTIFKDSFAENSTEKLNVTAQNMNEAKAIIKNCISALQAKQIELKNNHRVDVSLYKFINTLLKISDELEKYFNDMFSTLTTGLNKKLKATAFAERLTSVVKRIMTDDNFKKMNLHLDELQQHTPEIATKDICEIKADIQKLFHQYKSKAKNGAAALNMLRKRLPY